MFTIPKRNVIPGGVPKINWNDPLTKGLLACYLPAAYQGPIIYNLVGDGGDLTLDTGASYTITPEGVGLLNTSANGGAKAPAPLSFLVSPFASLYWRGYHFASATDNVALIGIQYTDTDVQPWEIFSIEQYVPSQIAADGEVNFSNFNALGPINNFNAFDRGSWGSTYDNTTGTFSLYKNGGIIANTINGAASGWIFINPTINFGYYSAVPTRIANTASMFGCIWNRLLSPQELREIDIDPYRFLVWPQDDMWASSVSIQKLKQASLDGIVALMHLTKTSSLDALVSKTITATSSLDSVVFKTAAKTAILGGFVARVGTKTTSLDARIVHTVPFATMDAFLRKQQTKTASLDANLTNSGKLTATFSLSIGFLSSASAKMDAVLYPNFSASPNRTAMIPEIPRTIDIEY